jgi:hypothetical protein
VKIGYSKVRTPRYTLFVKEMIPAVQRLDTILRAEEEWHGLEYRKKFRMVVLDEKKHMKRFVPWLKGDGYSVNLGFANLVYIGPNASKSTFGVEPYLKHELSHLLLHQNTTKKKDVFEMQRQGWLTEGTAVCFGGPDFYPTREAFLNACHAAGLSLNRLNESNIMKVPIQEIRLRYAFYGYFIQFLVEHYGLEKMQEYIKSYLNDPAGYQSLFPDIFGDELSSILARFTSYLQS